MVHPTEMPASSHALLPGSTSLAASSVVPTLCSSPTPQPLPTVRDAVLAVKEDW